MLLFTSTWAIICNNMRIRSLLKLSSGLMVAIIVAVSLIIFICPQSVMASSHQLSAGMNALCHNNSISTPMVNSGGTDSGCFDRHLAAAVQFTKTLFDSTKLWLILSLVILIIVGVVQTASLRQTVSETSVRLKYQYRRYLTHIRPCAQEKILAWLALYKNYDLASTV